MREEKKTREQKIQALNRIDVNRERWVRLQEILCKTLPEQMWLASIAESNQNPPILDIKGRTYSFPEVAAYMSNLDETDYVAVVDLSDIAQNNNAKWFDFSISCKLNPDAGMKRAHSREGLNGAVKN